MNRIIYMSPKRNHEKRHWHEIDKQNCEKISVSDGILSLLFGHVVRPVLSSATHHVRHRTAKAEVSLAMTFHSVSNIDCNRYIKSKFVNYKVSV